MSVADELEEAVAARVPILVGQYVIVRTKAGAEVAKGFVKQADPELARVWVQDISAGGDLQVDVDPKRYAVYIQKPEAPLPKAPPESVIYTRIGGMARYRGGH